MLQPDPIRVNFVKELTKLSLWYVRKVLREEEISFADAVNRVDIYRKTSLYDGRSHPSRCDVGPRWAEILDQVKGIFDRHRDDPYSELIEAEGLALLWPYLEARLLENKDQGKGEDERPYECWDGGYSDEGRLSIHIYNIYKPRSPLSDMRIPFAASLIRLLHDSTQRRPGMEIVQCVSWLNSAPRFQALFPNGWIRSARLRGTIGYTAGYWGQFYDRRGGFHDRNGAAFRETGELPFPCLSCEWPISEVMEHLEDKFPEAVAHNTEQGFVLQPRKKLN